MSNVEKRVSMQQHFEHLLGKQRSQERKYLGISEAEPLRCDCVNQFANKDNVGHIFMNFRHIEFRLVG